MTEMNAPSASILESGSTLKRRYRFTAVQIKATLSIIYLASLAAAAALAPWIMPYSAEAPDFSQLLGAPSTAHWLGTDDLGRDILTRVIYGAGPSLLSAFASVGLAFLFGVPFGLIAGYKRGRDDAVISRFIDALLAFPAVLFAIGLSGVLGPSLVTGIIVLGILFSPQFARLVRSRTLVARSELYVDASRVFGASTFRVLTMHILPNVVQSAIVNAGLLLSNALLAEASLSFLGFGVQPPATSWGAMLSRAYNYMETAPEQMLPAGIAILLTALAFNTLGDAIRRRLDPYASGPSS
jgi:peptide/nickel transport system permease protein